MKVLIVSQYFWPETFIINDFAETLAESGYDVSVLTGKPNYPEGEIFQGFRVRGVQKDRFGSFDIPVTRVPIWPRRSGSAINMVLNYVSFVLSGLLFSRKALKKEKFDLILMFAPSPITSAIPAIFLKKRFGAHLAIWVQDLWPESLSATGFIKNKHLLSSVGRVVSLIYKSADTLLAQSRSFVPSIGKRVNSDRVLYYPNCMKDPELKFDDEASLPAELLRTLETKFCLVFAGNMGTAQSLETLLSAAIQLRDNANIYFVLVGSGSRLRWLKSQKKALNLENLLLPGRFSPASIPQIYDRAEGLLVSLRKDEIFSQTIPSKIQSYLAAGRPVLASLDGEGAQVIVDAQAGLTSPSEDVNALVENITKLYAMSDSERKALGKNARRYFLDNFEMKQQVERFGEIMKSRMGFGG